MAEDSDESNVPFLDQLGSLLDKGYHEMALELFESPENRVEIVQSAWDVVPRLCVYLSQEVFNTRAHVIDTVEEMLASMVGLCQPKEMILVLLEQAESKDNDIRFCSLLTPVRSCIQRLSTKRAHSLAIALETLTSHPHHLPPPAQHNLELRERLLLDCDDNVRRISHVTEAYIHFLSPFVSEVDWQEVDHTARIRCDKQTCDLLRTCVTLMDSPLSHVDLSVIRERPARSLLSCRLVTPTPTDTHKDLKPQTRIIAESLMTLVNKLVSDHPRVMSQMTANNELLQRRVDEARRRREVSGEDGDEEDVSDGEDVLREQVYPYLGLCVLAYLVYGEELQDNSVPQVHSPGYTLESNLPFASHLLTQGGDQLVYKGLALMEGLLGRVPASSLPAAFVEAPRLKDSLDALIVVMTTSRIKELNQFAVVLLRLTINKFSSAGRNKFLLHLLNSTSHSGVLGYVVTMVKDEIDAGLRCPVPDPHLSGPALDPLYHTIYALPGGATTDLLHHAERIMGALNLLRYLVLRDPPGNNVTGVWNQVDQILSGYCEHLRTGINMTRAHYQLEMARVREAASQSYGNHGNTSSEVELTIDGERPPDMAPELQLDVYSKALHTLDMMESVLGRVTEVTDQQRHVSKPTVKDK